MRAKRTAVAQKRAARSTRGRLQAGAAFPIAPGKLRLPRDYPEALAEIKRRIQQEQLRVVVAANGAMIQLYWDIGAFVLERQRRARWGAKVIDRLSADLRAAYPHMKSFSRRNLLSMRAFAAAYPEIQIVKQVVSQLPWGHVVRRVQRVKDARARDWYVRKAIEHGWSRNVLEMQIDRRAHQREGKALNNFPATLPPSDSDMASEVFKDPYLFDFVGTADPRREREVEQALVDHIQRFLLELGTGFAFVGRQVALEVGDQDFFLDLLFYHLKLRCFVVIELKAAPFEASFVGQLNLYLSAVDDLLRHEEDKPTIGLLLCRSKDTLIVEYALRGLQKPIGVAQWETMIVEKLPKELEGSLPTVEDIEAELGPVTAKRKEKRR